MNIYITDEGKTRAYTDPVNFRIIDFKNDIGSLSELSIDKLRHLDVDALIIRNFLTSEEVQILLRHLFEKPENNRENLTQSKTYPCSFASLDRQSPHYKQKLIEYYQVAKQFKDTFAEKFQIDIKTRFEEILVLLNQNNKARVLETSDNGSYMPFTFRMIMPEQNHINLHCDNMFTGLAPEFYELLHHVAEVKNQLSFFTVLERPDKGGELSIYNVVWDVAKEFNIEQQTIILESGRHLHVENHDELRREQFDLAPGDLVIFAGGQLYHRVEEVYGSKMRITLGGFIGYSKTNSDIYYWS